MPCVLPDLERRDPARVALVANPARRLGPNNLGRRSSWEPRLLDLLSLASPTHQPTPSSGEFGRFIPINLRIAFARPRQIEESVKFFELF
jgi:hypothetical protein